MVVWAFDLFSSIALLHTSAQLVPLSLTTSFHHTSLRPSIFVMPLFLLMKHFHQPLTPSTPIDMFCHRILKTNSFNPSCKAAPWLTEPDFFPSHPHMSSWLRVTPSPTLGLHLTPSECQFAIKWWLGIQLCEPGSVCALCPTKALEAHHALTCKRGSDVIARHNHLRDTLHHLFKNALYNPKLEAGSGLGHDQKQSRPADILVNNCMGLQWQTCCVRPVCVVSAKT